MRILFTCQPSIGHLLPLLGLARAAKHCGHDVAILTHPEIAAIATDIEAVPAGASIAEGMIEVERRGFPSQAKPGPGMIELFAGAMVDLDFDEALARARAFRPDLIVADRFHVLGSVLAAALSAPWASHAVSGGPPSAIEAALDDRAARHFVERHLKPPQRIALVDPFPEFLHTALPGWKPASDRIAIRPTINAGAETPLARVGDRPTVLVTFGTTVKEPGGLAAAILSAVNAGCNVIVTERIDALPRSIDRARVRAIGFTSLGALLPAVDVVVTAGGTGTVLASLAAGLPLVIHPFQADQPFNAARVAACELGLTVEDLAASGATAAAMLGDNALLARVQAAALAIEAIDSPKVAFERLLSRLP